MPTYEASTGSWDDHGFPISGYDYQWLRAPNSEGTPVAIEGATAQTYEAASEEEAYFIYVDVTATNAGGSTTARSLATEVPAIAPVPPTNLTPPVIVEV